MQLTPTRVLDAIEQRLRELHVLMAARGPADPCLDLLTEHRELVRQRNAIVAALNGGA
jgi:hypothetical protein